MIDITNLVSAESKRELVADELKQIKGGNSQVATGDPNSLIVQNIGADMRVNLIPGQQPQISITHSDGTIEQLL